MGCRYPMTAPCSSLTSRDKYGGGPTGSLHCRQTSGKLTPVSPWLRTEYAMRCSSGTEIFHTQNQILVTSNLDRGYQKRTIDECALHRRIFRSELSEGPG